MSRTTKILLVIGGLVALACCGSVAAMFYFGLRVARNVDLDPGAANDTAAEIADYTLPEGYQAQMGVDLLGMKMALFSKGDIKTGTSGQMMLALIELPAGAASDAVKDSASRQMGGRVRDARQVDATDITLRGEKTTLTVSEGSGAGGKTVRQAAATFTAKSGKVAMLMAMGNAEDWDQAALDAFIASIQ